MMLVNYCYKSIIICLLWLMFLPLYAATIDTTNIPSPYYITGHIATFSGTFNQNYSDQTDVIAQNIITPIAQNGYQLSLGFGYSNVYHVLYVLGWEFLANYNTYQARFASGSNSTVFTDTMALRYQFDLTAVPGLRLSETLASYLKIGVSLGYITDQLTSPVGYNPSYFRYNQQAWRPGLVAGIGLKQAIKTHWLIFTEYNYHDYGTIHFPNFSNFTANYKHSAHLYSQDIVIGLTYRL
jgi:opacity protein-like surface antigen